MKYVVILFSIGILSLIGVLFISGERKALDPLGEVTLVRQEILQTPKLHLTTVLLGGDIMLGRSVTVEALDRQKDALFPYKNLTPLFQNADLVFVNLENPVVSKCPRQTTGMVFCAPDEMLSGLPTQKTIVNLANNHTLNHGQNGFTETIEILNQKQIFATGVSKLVTKKINGVTFGFIGFDKDQQVNPVLTQAEEKLVQESNSQVDVLFVALHWGVEYKAHPFEGQRKLAQKLVDLGADVIVGHHPHWVQDVDKIGETPVYYSLGNLIFDQMWSEETKKGLMIRLTFDGKKIIKQELIPTYIEKTGQPIIMPSPKE